MPVIALFSGSFCGVETILERLVTETGYTLCTDDTIVARAATLAGLPAAQLKRCFAPKPSVFNPFTRERERCLAWLRLALAEQCAEARWVLHGFTSHLLPSTIGHILHVCLIADVPHRLRAAGGTRHAGRAEAVQRLASDDRERGVWVRTLKGREDPWAADLYDMVLPTHTLDADQAVRLIRQGLSAPALQPTDRSRREAEYFLKAARIETRLAAMGHVVRVAVDSNRITLHIDRPVLMMERLESELKQAIGEMEITDEITITVDPADDKAVYRRFSDEQPSKVLLVDDEREFVQTLSERLGMRDIGSAVAYDGESALEMVAEEAPEVMLLDLQMPGIDGMEVLKRVKSTNPEIEVVILTGHGTAAHREQCLQLGAFAYLEKPVDIEVLSETLKQANAQMQRNRRDKHA